MILLCDSEVWSTYRTYADIKWLLKGGLETVRNYKMAHSSRRYFPIMVLRALIILLILSKGHLSLP